MWMGWEMSKNFGSYGFELIQHVWVCVGFVHVSVYWELVSQYEYIKKTIGLLFWTEKGKSSKLQVHFVNYLGGDPKTDLTCY